MHACISACSLLTIDIFFTFHEIYETLKRENFIAHIRIYALHISEVSIFIALTAGCFCGHVNRIFDPAFRLRIINFR